MEQPFVQAAPQLDNQYRSDPALRSCLRRALPPETLARIEPELLEMGELAAGELYARQLADRENEPQLVHWDAWGNRVDRIELTSLWKRAEVLAAGYGLTAIPYERADGPYSRLHQFALVHLFHPSTDVYTCPLAMTDGAARTLLDSGNQVLIDRAVGHLTSRDASAFWTSGQWMTESTGGSDAGASLTRAEPGEGGEWRLYGKKWFTSAATSQVALVLARPVGNGPGGSGLALFYVETRDVKGRLQGIRVERLKDKLGTRKVPTAEITLDGAMARLVGSTAHGTREIEPMLRITRVWNSVCAASFMRRGIALAADYARRRSVFGAPLIDQPLHRDTLAGLQAEQAGAFHLSFELVGLLGRDEAGELDDNGKALLRLMLPIAKLTTGKQSVAVLSEVLEAFGGAGYVEDTGLPVLLRDTQVLPIWEGTTNVLSLDALLRTDLKAGMTAWSERIAQALSAARDGRLEESVRIAQAQLDQAAQWLNSTREPPFLQAGARRFALALGRSMQLALLIEHAHWASETERDESYVAIARRFARTPLPALDAEPLVQVGTILSGLTGGRSSPRK
jgi:alkylation response protein AidB-like acyl-CoA dehydrogenase